MLGHRHLDVCPCSGTMAILIFFLSFRIARGVGCELCYKEYYYFNKRCEACSAQCQRNTTSESPTCNQIDGSCEFGCIKGYYGALCNKECSALCIDGDCGSDGCCTQGCRFDRYGGCR